MLYCQFDIIKTLNDMSILTEIEKIYITYEEPDHYTTEHIYYLDFILITNTHSFNLNGTT